MSRWCNVIKGASASTARRVKFNDRPVIIDGVTYPTIKAAAAARGRHPTSIHRMLDAGTAKYGRRPKFVPVPRQPYMPWNVGKTQRQMIHELYELTLLCEKQGIDYRSLAIAELRGDALQAARILVRRGIMQESNGDFSLTDAALNAMRERFAQ